MRRKIPQIGKKTVDNPPAMCYHIPCAEGAN